MEGQEDVKEKETSIDKQNIKQSTWGTSVRLIGKYTVNPAWVMCKHQWNENIFEIKRVSVWNR